MQRFNTIPIRSALSGLCLLVTILALNSCSGQGSAVELTIKQYQVPVLKYRHDNPILQVKLNVPADASPQRVTSITFNTGGTDDLSDIKAVRVLYIGKDSLWVKYEKPANKAGNVVDPVYPDDFIPGPLHYADRKIIDDWRPVQFGEDKPAASKVTFMGDQELLPGDNYFWLMY
ncbi:MAG: hypothetical protein MUC78_12365, partial [Bacteroidales bacterium]|nr:hypothetical protein [Bacteroidales bacterium]